MNFHLKDLFWILKTYKNSEGPKSSKKAGPIYNKYGTFNIKRVWMNTGSMIFKVKMKKTIINNNPFLFFLAWLVKVNIRINNWPILINNKIE